MMRNIAPEIYCREHLFAHVCLRTRLPEVLLRDMTCIVCMPAAGMIEKDYQTRLAEALYAPNW